MIVFAGNSFLSTEPVDNFVDTLVEKGLIPEGKPGDVKMTVL
jgi:hypothetical protein